jgi:biopolymer transport protein ExbD
MGAGATPGAGGKGGQRSLDFNLNLVPFIDLLSCTISFLLITAVWTSLARIDINQKTPGSGAEEPETPPEPKPQVMVAVDPDRCTLIDVAPSGERIETVVGKTASGDYNAEELTEKLKRVKQKYPEHNEIQILSTDGVRYENLVKTMDAALSAQFPDIAMRDGTVAAN